MLKSIANVTICYIMKMENFTVNLNDKEKFDVLK